MTQHNLGSQLKVYNIKFIDMDYLVKNFCHSEHIIIMHLSILVFTPDLGGGNIMVKKIMSD